MTVKDLKVFYDYSYWANGMFFDVIVRLTDDEFSRSVTGSYGSVRNTLVHMLSAEWGWLDRCGGHPRGPALVAADYPTARSVVAQWREVEAHMRSFLTQLKDEDLSRAVEFSLGSGPKQVMRLGELMQHAAVHGVHHRGQIAVLLRSLGHAPGNVDMLVYYSRK